VQSVDVERLAYLDESPWTAMARSFVVYLCIIAGVYLALDDPFKNPTPGQYAKLAGTFSALGFLVGYDPKRVQAWLRLIPGPPFQEVSVTKDGQGRLEIKAKQGPAGAAQKDATNLPWYTAMVTQPTTRGLRPSNPR